MSLRFHSFIEEMGLGILYESNLLGSNFLGGNSFIYSGNRLIGKVLIYLLKNPVYPVIDDTIIQTVQYGRDPLI